MKILFTAAAALAAFASVSAATAQTAPVLKVFYGDLDLNNPAGMATLTTRVERAAHTLCADRAGTELASRVASINCFRTAVAGAMKQVPVAAPQFASR